MEDYLQRIRAAAMDLTRERYLLEEDLEAILTRAKDHWIYATRENPEAPDSLSR